MKLRCWPGAIARISERCSVRDWHGKFITCEGLVTPGDIPTPPPAPPGFAMLIVHHSQGMPGPQREPEWTFSGQRLFSFVSEFGRIMEAYSIEDSVLDPITPPPGTDCTDEEARWDAARTLVRVLKEPVKA